MLKVCRFLMRDLRRCIQVSLRTSLVLLTILCVFLANRVNHKQSVQRLRLYVKAWKGDVRYDHQFDFSSGTYVDESQPNVPKVLLHILGDEAFASIVQIDFQGTDVNDDVIANLPSLDTILYVSLAYTDVTDRSIAVITRTRGLRTLSLDGCAITDGGLSLLTGCNTLEALYLDGTLITDDSVEHLQQMKSIKYLSVRNTAVTSHGLLRLRDALPDCEIEG